MFAFNEELYPPREYEGILEINDEDRYRLRRFFISDGKFTPQMAVKILNLNPQLVYTEISRLVVLGYLDYKPDTKTYSVTHDLLKRNDYIDSVHSYEFMVQPQPLQPSSESFQIAVGLIDKACRLPNGGKREECIRKAEIELEYAEFGEELGRTYNPVVEGFIERERNRIAELQERV